MGKIKVELNNNILTIKKDSVRNINNEEIVEIEKLKYGEHYLSSIVATTKKEYNKIFLLQEISNVKGDENELIKNVVIVYSVDGKVKYAYGELNAVMKKVVKLKFKVLNIKLNKRRLSIRLIAYLVNKPKAKIGDIKFFVDGDMSKPATLKEYRGPISIIKMFTEKNMYKFKFKMKDILQDDSTINGNIRFEVNVDGYPIQYNIAKKDRRTKNLQHHYAPYKSTWTKDYAVHIRRTIAGNLVLVKRLKEPVERTLKFRIMESKFVSRLLYKISNFNIKHRKRKINVFYEKFSSKAEEGTYDLFLLMQKDNKSRNYFVITEDSPDYEKIKDNKDVIKKYSLKYYWIIFNADNFISTEAPIHLNILRSNNTYLRKSLTDKPFVFLQHGITYLKCQGKNSTFAKNKEGQVDYIVVGSEKEKEVIVESLDINDEQVLNTGLPIFSKIDYKHINNDSDDFVTVMLTWKPYEEQLLNFEESTYYQNVIKICKMLEKYIDKSKILLISHPKAQTLIEQTDLKDSIWHKPISEALEKTKLLITDYSSVCYNTFYQGGGVIFFQPDLDFYEKENGPLYPSNDEYIGKRTFNLDELEEVIKKTIKNKKIDLNEVRTDKFEENYKTINEFSDGKNIERIYEKIKELKLI